MLSLRLLVLSVVLKVQRSPRQTRSLPPKWAFQWDADNEKNVISRSLGIREVGEINRSERDGEHRLGELSHPRRPGKASPRR